MSIELPGWVVDAFSLVGLPWPGIDEDQLRAWAGGLRAYAGEITALSGSSRSAVAALAASGDSSFGRTLAAQWEHHHTLISDLRGPMEVFAGALDIAADAVAAQKVVVIGAAVLLAGEVIATQGEALVTFGLAEAEVPAEVAIARMAVKAALQELEGQLLGLLINKAAAEISSLVGGTVGKLISGGGQVAAEAVSLTADYHAMQTLSGALSGHAGRVEQASSVGWRKAGSGKLEEGGPGGGWREVARAVEQTVLQVLKQLFIDLGRALWTIITDTIAFLKKAIAALRHTDDTLAADARRAGDGGGGLAGGNGGTDAGSAGAKAAPVSSPLDMVPEGASRRVLAPDPNGGAQEGVEFKWINEQGQTVRLRIHGPDGTAPAGSNAAEGPLYRVQVGGRYTDAEGNLYPRGVHNPNSPHYDPEAANATHIPWPSDIPLPW
jgi:Bacterial toxin 30